MGTRRLIDFMDEPTISMANATFWNTDLVGIRRKSWNTMPMLRRK